MSCGPKITTEWMPHYSKPRLIGGIWKNWWRGGEPLPSKRHSKLLITIAEGNDIIKSKTDKSINVILPILNLAVNIEHK